MPLSDIDASTRDSLSIEMEKDVTNALKLMFAPPPTEMVIVSAAAEIGGASAGLYSNVTSAEMSYRSAGMWVFAVGVLALIVVGLASGHHSFAAIAASGRRREEDLIPMLGLPRAPSHKTVWRIAGGVAPEAVRGVLRKVGGEELRGFLDLAVAVDGKCMRGSRTKSGDQANVVMAVEHSTGVVLDALDVPAGGCEKIAGRAMMRELARKPQIALFSGDALYADRPSARAVVDKRKHYAFKLKGGTSPASSTT